MAVQRIKESDILRTILDGLAAMHIWAIRMNSGAMYGSHKGKRWAVRFGRKGMADILALQVWETIVSLGDGRAPHKYPHIAPLWIEVKQPGKKQTPDQLLFQKEVEAEGHRYLVASSWESVLAVIQGS